MATISRSRRVGTSSTRGTSVATLELDGTLHHSGEADGSIFDLLSVQADEFGSSIYLRQETISQLILGNEDLRSAAIDKLLGLGQVRELLKNIQIGPIERALKQLNEEIRSQQENVITAATMRRVQLAKKRDELTAGGIDEAALSVAGASGRLEAIATDLEKLAGSFEIQAPAIQPHQGTPAELQYGVEEMTTASRGVDTALTQLEVEIRRRNGRLEDLGKQYERASTALRDLQGVDVDALNVQLTSLEREKQEAEDRLNGVRKRRLAVAPLSQQLDLAFQELNGLRDRIQQTERQDFARQKLTVGRDVEETRRLLEQQSALQRLLAAARDQLHAHPTEQCPVCAQRIDPDHTLARLDQLLSTGGQQSMQLTDRLNELDRRQHELDRKLEDLSRDRDSMAEIEKRLGDLIQRLRDAGVDTGQGSLEEVQHSVNELEDEYRAAADRLAVTEEQHSQLKARAAGVESAQGEFEQAVGTIKEVLESTTVPSDIPAAVSEALRAGKRRASEISAGHGQIQQRLDDLATTRDIIAYLREVEEVTDIEQNLPPVQRRLRQLAAARRRVSELFEAALDVHDALTSTQQESLRGNLTTLMPGVQDIFTGLGAHPEFRRLVIVPETDAKTGTNLYRIRAQAEKSGLDTSVRTTFSRAELNIVALALFTALTRSNDSRLRASILDDPSQSLDSDRKRLLAEVLIGLAEDRQVIVATEDEELAGSLSKAKGSQAIDLRHQPFKGVVST
jgi:DNA repair exonuclease SbcCD ATPase subunit